MVYAYKTSKEKKLQYGWKCSDLLECDTYKN